MQLARYLRTGLVALMYSSTILPLPRFDSGRPWRMVKPTPSYRARLALRGPQPHHVGGAHPLRHLRWR